MTLALYDAEDDDWTSRRQLRQRRRLVKSNIFLRRRLLRSNIFFLVTTFDLCILSNSRSIRKFPSQYDSRVEIYKRKLFMRLATDDILCTKAFLCLSHEMKITQTSFTILPHCLNKLNKAWRVFAHIWTCPVLMEVSPSTNTDVFSIRVSVWPDWAIYWTSW